MPSALRAHGAAFACGFMRLFSLGFILSALMLLTYFVFIIWSFCEEMKVGGAGAGFPQLLQSAGEYRVKRRQGPAWNPGVSYGQTYGSAGGYLGETGAMNSKVFAPASQSQNSRLFGGSYHE